MQISGIDSKECMRTHSQTQTTNTENQTVSPTTGLATLRARGFLRNPALTQSVFII